MTLNKKRFVKNPAFTVDKKTRMDKPNRQIKETNVVRKILVDRKIRDDFVELWCSGYRYRTTSFKKA